MKKQTTITLDSETHAAGRRLADADRRTFSAELEFLILAEAERRGIPVPPLGGPPAAAAVATDEAA